jgi:hypothetical protein
MILIGLFFLIWALAMGNSLGNPFWPVIVYPVLAAGITAVIGWYFIRKAAK